MKIQEIFTPNDTPTVTYVGREDLRLEEKLAEFLSIPKMITSISGPSKTGKTVLVRKVLMDDVIIPVVGPALMSPEDVWVHALRWMEVPSSTVDTSTIGGNTTVGGKVSGGLGFFGFAKGNAEASASNGSNSSTAISNTTISGGLAQVIREIANSDYVIFLDDFHYIQPEIRENIGRQLKVAAENGVRILTASVPHRADDVVRSNAELRGRVAALDVGRWDERHLIMIAQKGFAALNLELSPDLEKRLASESHGSPQLMQTICYCLCDATGIKKAAEERRQLVVSDAQLNDALSRTAIFTDFSKMLSVLHSGPRTRGTERKVHEFIDGSVGDVYRAVLLAIKSNPVSLSFTYEDLLTRVRSSCRGDSPAGSSITQCLEQMKMLCEQTQPGSQILAWDGDTLDIVDPYFAFFIRCSDKLNSLSRAAS